MQRSDSQLAGIGVVTPHGITRLALFGFHTAATCEGTSRVTVQLLNQTASTPGTDISMSEPSRLLGDAMLSCCSASVGHGQFGGESSSSSSSATTSALQQLPCVLLQQMPDEQRAYFGSTPMLDRWEHVATMLRKLPHQLRVRYLWFEVLPGLQTGLVEPLDCSMLQADDFGMGLSMHPLPGCSQFDPPAL